MRLRSGLKLLGIDLMVSNQIIFTFHSICSVYSVHMHHLGVTLHCVIRIGRGWDGETIEASLREGNCEEQTCYSYIIICH